MIDQKNIPTILRRLHGGEHAGAGEEIVENIKADAETLLEVKEDWDKYEAGVCQEGIIYDQTPESPKTRAIAAFDKKRNKYWKEILRRLKFSLNNPDEDVCTAADRLLFILNSFGNVSKNNLFEKTIAMRRILNELKDDEIKEAIALIKGLDDLLDDIEALNDELHEKYDQRRMEWEKIKELGTLSNYRKVVDKLFFNVLDSINAVERVNGKGAKNPVVTATVERIRLELSSIFSQLQKNLSRRGIKTGKINRPGDGDSNDSFQTQDTGNPPPAES
ncbi:hypothetical protein FACS189435_2320 [Bacteroidia bacterium]|nr:hypothetical protein FACS189435_2320 [Bacteroidia bacterium]